MISRRAAGLAAVAALATGTVAGTVAGPAVAATSVPAPAGTGTPPATASVPCGTGESQWIGEPPFALSRLGASDAWRLSTGQGITVAVVDSGVDAANPHFAGAIRPGVSLLDGDPRPDGTWAVNNHGTAVASIIAARPVEGSQLYGIARQANVMPVRVFASDAQEDVTAGNGLRVDRIAAGIRWAVDNGADIVNVSLSAPAPDPDLESAVAHARANDVLVVASVGNSGDDGGTGPRWPAAYDGVLGVTATTTTDEVTDASVASPAVDVAAPGQDVAAAWFDQRDCVYSPGTQAPQTSWATAYVSGVAALVMAALPDAGADEVAYRIMATADRPVRGARDDVRGWGIVQPYLAMTATLDPARAGPPAPGDAAPPPPPAPADAVTVAGPSDAWAGSRRGALWWLLGGGAVVGMLGLGRVWSGRPAEVPHDRAPAHLSR